MVLKDLVIQISCAVRRRLCAIVSAVYATENGAQKTLVASTVSLSSWFSYTNEDR